MEANGADKLGKADLDKTNKLSIADVDKVDNLSITDVEVVNKLGIGTADTNKAEKLVITDLNRDDYSNSRRSLGKWGIASDKVCTCLFFPVEPFYW